MTDEERYGGYTPLRATKFFIPLLLQAFSQSLTYPLVAAIAAHGEYGEGSYAAFAQGHTVMFMIGALGGGLVMTGMVFARNFHGYRSFVRLNTVMMSILLSVQLLISFPPIGTLVFRDYLGLAPHLVDTSIKTLFWSIPMQGAFFLRNIPLVVLFNNRESGLATLATAVRILITVAAAFAFVPMGLIGTGWAVIATSIPCFVEFLLSHIFARKYVPREGVEVPEISKDDDAQTKTTNSGVIRQFKFTLPLSLGGFLLATAPSVIAAFINRTANPVAMLAIHYATIGFANPVGYAAFRMQAVAIQFPPEYKGDKRVVRYAAFAGLVLGIVPLVISLPRIGDWIFHDYMNLQESSIFHARVVMACYGAWPAFQCVRGYLEGYSAHLKHPGAVLVGQITYILTLSATLAIIYALGAPGWIMGFASIFSATIFTIFAIRKSLVNFKGTKQ